MTWYKVKIKDRYISAVGPTRQAQKQDADALAKRYNGKVVSVGESR
jgi:hypothetical protein